MVIGPLIPKLSGPARMEFVAKGAPRFARFAESFSVLTLLFGVAMVAVIVNGDFASISFATPFWVCIAAGALLALVDVALAFSAITPSVRKMARYAEAALQDPGAPPPEFVSASKRLSMASAVSLVILILVTVFMVAAAAL